MLSTVDLERLITVKRREIEKEKMLLGLSPKTFVAYSEECKTESKQDKVTPKVSNVTDIVEDNEGIEGHNQNGHKSREDLEDISPELDRYIRRYLGLPVMLKAGEYSPNNPLIRGERPSGDALLGLGEYERRRNTLRKLRQQQYREYLDQQAKKKQEAKEKAERERRQRQEREREEEERERARLERERASPERRRTYNYENVVVGSAGHYVGKVDTGVQVESMTHPLSVAVQTDDTELYRFNCADKLTEAERELSPRTVLDRGDNYSQCDAKGSREKVTSELRHTYKPSIFDADAIHMRNLQVEKETAEKRQFYQQELRNQIKEQQRIREERKAREKMLEIAEMRRLEEQLRMLRVAQETEIGRQVEIDSKMKENATDYEKKRSALQKEIDTEQRALFRNGSKTVPTVDNRNTHTSKSDPVCQRTDNAYTEAKNYSQPMTDVNVKSFTIPERSVRKTNAHRPFSINIPETSIFSPNYDVESYLRRNLNPSKHSLRHRLGEGIDKLHEEFDFELNDFDYGFERDYNLKKMDSTFSENKVNRITEKALIHEQPKGRGSKDHSAVPVLRRSPKSVINDGDNGEMSDAMKIVDGKWQVPVAQKSMLKSQPSEEGKKVSILTQLGSIRRQLQMEQLRLDNISNRSDQ